MKTHPFFLLSLTAAVSDAFTWQQGFGLPPIGNYFGLPGQNATYDYVIVGGGTAGLVVASRLAESNRSLSIAVIEPGTFYEISNGNNSQIPAYSEASEDADVTKYVNRWIDWHLITVPQAQFNNARIHYAQGKAIGGSSARNQMIYNRGTKGSYDLWAKLVGDESYSWCDILPFFKKSIHFTPPSSLRAANATTLYSLDDYSPTGGPLQLSYPNYATPFGEFALPAMRAAGFPELKGFSSGDLHGASFNPFTIDATHQMRSSSEVTFLAQVINSGKPLTLFPMSQAQRILFNGTTATGVQVHSAGMDWTLFAKKEVIVSAGWSHSPQLLMVSGIGPAKTLKAHNITVVKDLPGVGQNLHDSCNVGAVVHNVTLNNVPTTSAQAIQGYINNATGPLTNSGGDVLSFEKLPASYRTHLSTDTLSRLASTWPSDWPEVEYVASARGGPGNTVGGGVGNIGMLLVATLSRGNVTISSASMKDSPVISPNWLLDPADQEVAVQGYKRAREIWSHLDPSVKGPEFMPGANVSTDAQLRHYILANGYNRAIHHGSSTCMMGRQNETLAVVDSKGRVFGTQRLRVIDSSSFRFTPPGHTQAATYAHAEKLVMDVLRGL